LVEVIQKAYRNWASTRKIEHAVKDLGIECISALQVSEINKGLVEMVEEFRNWTIKAEYPVLWIDILYEKICGRRSMENMTMMFVKGVNI